MKKQTHFPSNSRTLVPWKNQRQFIFLSLFGFLLVLSNPLNANNIAVSNVTLTGQNTSTHSYLVQFDISWENSWRINTGPSNWDAAWVFMKFRLKNTSTWQHAIFNYVDGSGSGDGHTAPSNCAIESANDIGGTSGSNGVFIHRSSAMAQGSVSYSGVQLRWDYGEQGFFDNDLFEIKVYAIEMVYVPTGAFMVGDGLSEASSYSLYSYPGPTPYYISSENAITVGTSSGNLYYNALGDQSGPIPSTYPKGYQAFYTMKYEITQEQYVEFLNTLDRASQDERTATDLSYSTTSITNRYVMSNTSYMSVRNGIRCDATISSSSEITFYCDYDGDGIPNESNDGQNIACNYFSFLDLDAYLDWAALRIMTELEFEKVCRGSNISPIPGEFVWGGTTYNTSAVSILNPGEANESTTNFSTTKGNVNFLMTAVGGPLRVGAFSANPSNAGRMTSGASYYGSMELGGNVWEIIINIGTSSGRAYTGVHGNGILNSGNADVNSWPGTTGEGMGLKGGSISKSSPGYCRISDRSYSFNINNLRVGDYGGRGVRTAP